MLLQAAAIAAFLVGGEYEPELGFSAPESGWPVSETTEQRVHIGKNAHWILQSNYQVGVSGWDEGDVDNLVETLKKDDEPWKECIQFRRVNIAADEHVTKQSRGKSRDVLMLALFLQNLAPGYECSTCRWDKSTLELQFELNDSPTYPSIPVPMFVSPELDVAGMVTIATFQILSNVSPANSSTEEDEALIQDLAESFQAKLILTTCGRIHTEELGVVSEDGKKLTLDLTEFAFKPPKKWSIRIDGL